MNPPDPTDILNITEELKGTDFRIAIFGSARITAEDPLYKDVYELAKEMGQHKFDIVTGGGPGLMTAANSGHADGSLGNGSHSIGLTIRVPHELANDHLNIKEHFDRFSKRLDTFMALSQVVVVMPGGVGTCLEFFYAWQLTQVKHICSIPIILYGEMWVDLLEWVKRHPLKDGYINSGDLRNIFLAKTREGVLHKILQFHEVFQKEGEKFCLNYKKYQIE